MPTFHDKEFGDITVRRSHLSRSVKLSIAPNGTIRISMPTYTPLFIAKRLLNSSRQSLRRMQSSQSHSIYEDGMKIGKSHSLSVTSGSSLSVIRDGQMILATLPSTVSLSDTKVQREIRKVAIEALRKEAKSYLPRRLDFLANQHGFSYSMVRYSHASSRWGSCNNKKVISLNIALMKLTFEEIDYVLIHELAHTEHLNHSDQFWQRVEECSPDYKLYRAAIKQQTPSL